ncbi:hypothetical protein QBC40DRAFT_164538 [Triangularia verruculosa]|uniref:Uncharacterized protein n=1 Tax=Triangularia verruculosa TaxID=2587418 RepID=A0AAN6XPN2_9PEZI|nr:hypothetical protein QBC40DRAFT_164538 [Triangularia verruculosa]
MSRPGARPIRPGELDAYPGYARREEIINRADYLLENYLEVPPHIQAAFDILSRKGEDWATAHPGIICNIISSLPPDLPERKIYRRDNLTEPDPENEPGYYKIMRRILLSESLFYGIDAQAPAGHLLEQFRLSSATPGSFKNQLQQAGISITTLFTFTRTISRYAKDNKMLASGEPSARSASSSKPPSAPYSKGPPTELRSGMHWKGLQQQNHDRQAYFISDMARFLRGKPDNHTTLKHLTFALPDSASPHEYLDKGILKINSRTLVFDTTLNDTLLKLIQELDVKPGVIIKEFCFWRDGEDTNLPENPPKWS